MTPRDELLSYLSNRPLAIDASRLDAMLQAIDAPGRRAESLHRAAPAARRTGTRTAVLPLRGFIDANDSPALRFFGGTGLDTFAADFDRLVRDDTIDRIVLAIDSPGGSVYSVQETADQIYRARRVKKIDAIAAPMAASAAFWLGSQADSFAVQPSGEVGSIGVIAVHSDYSRADELAGVRRTVLRYGRLKGAGNSSEPLTEEVRARLQSQIDSYGRTFTAAVARGRDVRVDVVRGPSWGSGMTLLSRDALDVGMVDTIATLPEFIAQGGTQSKGKSAAGIAAMRPDLATYAAKAALAGLQ